MPFLPTKERIADQNGWVTPNWLRFFQDASRGMTPYTPVWSAGVAPAIGNGSLVGRYVVANGVVSVNLVLRAGTTTSFGVGEWAFSVPVPAIDANAGLSGAALVTDSGTGYFSYVPTLTTTRAMIAIRGNGSADLLGAALPMAWASGDSLQISFSYFAA